MRRLFLYDEFFTSPLAPTEILRRVEHVTAPPATGWRKWLDVSPEQRYKGDVYPEGSAFELESSASRPNSFSSVIMGSATAAETGEGAAVRLTVRLRPVQQFLATTWLAVVGCICLAMLVIRPGWGGVLPFLLLGGPPFSFWLHVWEEKRFFKNLLQLVESSSTA